MNWFWTILVIGGLWFMGAVVGNNPDHSGPSRNYDDSGYESRYDNYDEYDYASEPENPYSTYEEGHYAGYEWAEENDVDDCDGNSDSFIEGCQEYVDQRDAYEEQQYYEGENYYEYDDR